MNSLVQQALRLWMNPLARRASRLSLFRGNMLVVSPPPTPSYEEPDTGGLAMAAVCNNGIGPQALQGYAPQRGMFVGECSTQGVYAEMLPRRQRNREMDHRLKAFRWGYSSVGRALQSHCRGQRFDSA